MSIDILDYGIGNIGSVVRMIEKVGGSARAISTVDEIRHSNKIILPGVGHFDHGISQINERGFSEALRERVIKEGVPIMGICLGMQLLCARSEEGSLPGLGFVNADVRKFKILPGHKIKIPHMGWNSVHIVRKNSLIKMSDEDQRFYFVHSYYVEPKSLDLEIMTANYGINFCAAYENENIFGVQFHPEKSHRFGMALLKQFINI